MGIAMETSLHARDMMEVGGSLISLKQRLTLFQKRWLNWQASPIPGLSISSSGLFALADLSTIAKHTSLTGTSTWLDILVLAPGLHYQQQADTVDGGSTISIDPKAFNTHSGRDRDITNQATIRYLQRIGNKTKPTILDIGPESRQDRKETDSILASTGRKYKRVSPLSTKLSSTLYACGPLMTITATILMILAHDWWGLAIILALIVSRALNVWIIRARTADQPTVPTTPNVHQSWWVNIDGQNVCLRGHAHDLDAITTGEWMRAKTVVEGYYEAMAKVIVYLVAIFSGNVFQTGNIILLVLLSASAALLALSNACTSTFSMNGRTASVVDRPSLDRVREKRQSERPDVAKPGDGKSNGGKTGWAGDDKGTDSMSDFERLEAKTVIDSAYPFDEDVNYV